MQLTLKGKVKKLGITFGIIKSNDYNELHFFIISDIIENDRLKIKLADTVSFELKTNKARGSNAIKIKLFSNENINNDLIEDIQSKKPVEASIENKILNFEKPYVSVNAFQNFITEGFCMLDIENDDLNNIIKMVVRDNVITDIERNFLEEKTLELNISSDLVKKANEYLFSNNPFFDNILAMIFKDGVIKENELAFLFEKSKENNFSISFINNRFWQYYFTLHFDKLLEFKNIEKIIKLWYLSKNIKFDLAMNKDWLIMQLNILESTKIEENINRALNHFENVIFNFLKNKFNLSTLEVGKIYDYVTLDHGKSKSNSSSVNDVKNKSFSHNKIYKKEDIYEFFKVSKDQQKGKWHNGYCEHNGNWFIFANIGQLGHGFSLNNDFDYNNSLDELGDLNWEAINNSKLSWDSIQKLKSSSPYIFIRKPETEKNYWEYLGMAICTYTLDTTPVKFKWKILKDYTEVESEKTDNKISKSKEVKLTTEWNKSIVPVKYKARIIDLINDNDIFDASQEYLNLAYENDHKNPSKVMKEFERLIESLDK